MDNEEYMMEQAEWAVWEILEEFGYDMGEISDTGTVENVLLRGYTLEDIVDGQAESAILDNISWLY